MILTIHFACCLAMTAVIWLVQLLNYPSFEYIEPDKFKKFHEVHCHRISYVVTPLMGIELITAIILATATPSWIWLTNLASVIFIWGATAILSVPQHNKLLKLGKDLDTCRKLTSTNWWRTIAWSLRSVALTYFVFVIERY